MTRTSTLATLALAALAACHARGAGAPGDISGRPPPRPPGGATCPQIDVAAQDGASADPAIEAHCRNGACAIVNPDRIPITLEHTAAIARVRWSTWVDLSPGERALATLVTLDDPYGPHGEMDVITYVLVVTRGHDKLAELEWGNDPPEGESTACESKVALDDRDCDGTRDQMTVTIHCYTPMCTDSLDPETREQFCSDPPAPDQVQEWRRAADGTFTAPSSGRISR